MNVDRRTLLAALASVTLPVASLLLISFGDPPDASASDAAERSSFLILLFSPLLFPPAALYFVAIPAILRWSGSVTLKRFLLADALVVGALVGPLVVAKSQLLQPEPVFAGAVVGGFAFVTLAFGSITWVLTGPKTPTAGSAG